MTIPYNTVRDTRAQWWDLFTKLYFINIITYIVVAYQGKDLRF